MQQILQKIKAVLDNLLQLLVRPLTFTETKLTALGSTAARDVSLHKRITFEYTVANINTNVIVRFEGRLGKGNFANLDADEVDTTVTSNGTFLAQFTARLSEVRFTFVSELGGTAATIDVNLMLGN